MKNLKLLLFVIFIIVIIIFIQSRSVNYENLLEKKGVLSIGKIDSIEKFPKRSYIHISYFINKKKYHSFESGLKKGIDSDDIGKFYEIKYLEESPNIIRANFSKQIIDSVSIIKAGFGSVSD